MKNKISLPEIDLSTTDAMFLDELSTEAEKLLNRHEASPREFFPDDITDQMVEALRDGSFVPEEAPLSDAVKSSLYINYLTEEGLPYYTSALDRRLPLQHAFRDWLHTWTSDEGRHAPAIKNYMHFSRQFDMHTLERARVAMMKFPNTPQPASFIEGNIYPAFQEPATKISHRNTMLHLPKTHKIGKKALAFVIGDEAKHEDFYSDMTAAALKVSPSITLLGIAYQIRGFAMPGKSIPEFTHHKKVIEDADIFGLSQLKAIYDEKLTKSWDIWNVEGLDETGEKALQYIHGYIEQMGRLLIKATERRERLQSVN